MVSSFLSATSNLGTLVVEALELDTDMCTALKDLALVFQKWRPKWMDIDIASIMGAQVFGGVILCVIEDPDATPPTTFEDFAENRWFACSLFGDKRMPTLHYVPDFKTSNGWFFTDDQLANVDRLEMPGTLYVGTYGWAAAYTDAFRLHIKFEVEFCDFQNRAVSPLDPSVPLTICGKLYKPNNEPRRKRKAEVSKAVVPVVATTPALDEYQQFLSWKQAVELKQFK
jgi:hypothetical protein